MLKPPAAAHVFRKTKKVSKAGRSNQCQGKTWGVLKADD
jgi:hypothetical protein